MDTPGGQNHGLGSGKGTHFSIPLQGSGMVKKGGRGDNLKFFPDTFFGTDMWTSPDPYLTLSCALVPSLPGFHSRVPPLALILDNPLILTQYTLGPSLPHTILAPS